MNRTRLIALLAASLLAMIVLTIIVGEAFLLGRSASLFIFIPMLIFDMYRRKTETVAKGYRNFIYIVALLGFLVAIIHFLWQ